MRFGSLFAGIGGFDLGLERAGMECAWQVEIDPFCRKVLEKHWPHVKRYEDVREVGKHNLEPVDLICGGFPCQDISNAGKRAGIDGERSGLWSEFHRIICELRPRYALVENVAALLGRGMGRVLGDLAACGYDAEWEILPACTFGAPHIRERLFLLAYSASERTGNQSRKNRGQGRKQANSSQPKNVRQTHRAIGARRINTSRKNVSNSNGVRASQYRTAQRMGWLSVSKKDGSIGERGRAQWSVEPDVGRVADGIPSRLDRLRGLGNAVVPQVAEWIGRRILECAEH